MQHILVVDDNAGVRGYLGDILKSAGYHVHEAANGSTVIDLLDNNPVDLVVTDIVMPITDGIETIRDVKRRFPDIKIIAASGYNFYLEMAGKLGADRIIEKPFNAEKLLIAIRMLLRPGRSASQFVGARVPHASRPDHLYRPKRGAAHAVREKFAPRSKTLATMGILLVLAGCPLEADAAPITPDDVYRVTGMINGELELLHESNDSIPTVDINAPDLTPRRPRHVLQKAREVLLKVQLLRKINGLPESALPPMPLREVRPADVKKMVDLIEQDIVALRPVFGVTKSPVSVPRPSGKRPTDVYADLDRATARLDVLGIPRIVPNDIYRVALTIIGDLEKVRSARGLTEPVPMQSGTRTSNPATFMRRPSRFYKRSRP